MEFPPEIIAGIVLVIAILILIVFIYLKYFGKEEKKLSGNENDVADFGCAVESGNIIYGAQGKTVNYDIPKGSRKIRVDNSLKGDPIGGVFKQWNAKYKCE
jgi:hypothetical protein